ncbi:MAG: hypothetical protein JWO31_3023 [Phycisphaerales bacterium]|nr:hypothetical protein [Phycisphaerales bacterium]
MTDDADPSLLSPNPSASTAATDQTATPPAGDGEIVANRDVGHFVKRCVLIPVLIVVAGLYFLYDGYVGYPKENARYDALTAQVDAARARGDAKGEADAVEARKAGKAKHSDLDIQIQKTLGYVLPPLGLLAFAFFYRQSRGRYRLADDVLHAPGHPPVPLDAIRTIDKTRWDRKGIAYLGYELDAPTPAGRVTRGTVKLDDALYQQGPTTAILKSIEAKVAPAEAI